MKKHVDVVLIASAIAIPLLVVLFLVAPKLVSIPAPASSQDWAAWVQAVGAILAILVAVAVLFTQHWLENVRKADEQRAAEQRVLEGALLLAIQVAAFTADVTRSLSDPRRPQSQSQREAFRRQCLELAQMTRQLALQPLPTIEAVSAAYRLVGVLSDGTTLLEPPVMRSLGEVGEHDLRDWKKLLKRADDARSTLAQNRLDRLPDQP